MTRIDENHSTEMADKRNGVLPADVFGALCKIGEIAGIMRDIAAREISENKPIAGTAVDMLAKMIEAAVADGMGDTHADNPGQHQTVPFKTNDLADAPGGARNFVEFKINDLTDGEKDMQEPHTLSTSTCARHDPAWPGGLDLRNLHAAIAGCVTVLCGLQFVAEDSQIDPEAFEPLLATLTPWRDRVLAARDDLEMADVPVSVMDTGDQ